MYIAYSRYATELEPTGGEGPSGSSGLAYLGYRENPFHAELAT